MKKIVFFLFILLVVSTIIFHLSQSQNPPQTEGIETSATKELTNSASSTVSPLLVGEGKGEVRRYNFFDLDNDIRVAWVKIGTSSALKLYPNFSEKLSAIEAQKKYSCSSILNAGFYDKNGQPLGLFITNRRILSKNRPSAFFNGYFYSINNVLEISQSVPDLNSEFALQSGPILWLKGTPLELKIIDDEPSRRIVAAVDSAGQLVFLAFYDKDNDLQGPLLADLPKLLTDFSYKTNIKFSSALNLDGGSASAFYTDGISLSELSLVGGFFCVK